MEGAAQRGHRPRPSLERSGSVGYHCGSRCTNPQSCRLVAGYRTTPLRQRRSTRTPRHTRRYALTYCPKTAMFPALSWWPHAIKGGVGLRGRDSWEPLAWAAARRKARRSAASRFRGNEVLSSRNEIAVISLYGHFLLCCLTGRAMVRSLDLVDTLVAAGREDFTFEAARTILGVPSPATAKVLRQLRDQGFVERLSRSHYAIRPLGLLGTSATADDLPLAVAAAFDGRQHRIAYLSALAELGLLTHPARTVVVACTQQVRRHHLGRRPLRVVIERSTTIHLGAETMGRSWHSGVERAVFECALRVDLVGGPEALASALQRAASTIRARRLAPLVKAFGPRGVAAERRLASLAPLTSRSTSAPRFRPLAPSFGSIRRTTTSSGSTQRCGSHGVPASTSSEPWSRTSRAHPLADHPPRLS